MWLVEQVRVRVQSPPHYFDYAIQGMSIHTFLSHNIHPALCICIGVDIKKMAIGYNSEGTIKVDGIDLHYLGLDDVRSRSLCIIPQVIHS